jgi:soluble lytic murein transglycosylase
MPRKPLVVLCVTLLALLVLVVVLIKSIPLSETAGYATEPHVLLGDDLHALLLLENLPYDQDMTEERLVELARQEDTVGYHANLALAGLNTTGQTKPEAYLRCALELYDSKAIRFQLASYLAENGYDEEAAAEYLGLLPEEQALKALLKMGTDNRVILEKLASDRHWQELTDFLDTLWGGSDKAILQEDLPVSLLSFYAQAMVGLEDYEKALPLLERILEDAADDLHIRWLYARSLEAQGQSAEAMDAYRKSGAAGAYRLGLLLEKEGEKDQAASMYGKSNEAASLWRGAVLWDEMGRGNDALEIYIRIASEPGIYQDDAAYRSFLLLSKDGNLQADDFLALLAPQSAWMSRIGQEPSWRQVPDPSRVVPDFLHRVEIYQQAGREDFATLELAIAEKNAGPEEKIVLGEWYLERGNTSQAIRWGSEAVKDLPCRRAYTVAYPQLFTGEVESAAAEYHLEPELLWAVIREESRFRLNAVSRAGAMGLMQIMPATGRDIANRLHVAFADHYLFNSDLNIRFGAFYLRSMLNIFENDLDKALAAYNGGAGNVRRWSGSNLGASTGAFPTAITFLETREYITKVKNSYHTYRWLYSE